MHASVDLIPKFGPDNHTEKQWELDKAVAE